MGILIGLEGIDGSGKTTTLPLVIERLREKGLNCKLINKKKSDYDDLRIRKYAENIKNLIWYKEDDPYKFVTEQGWLYFHALWYSILTENEINPNLEKFDLLIVDGWFYKMYCRFLLKENFNKNLLQSIYQSIKKCDKVFLLNVKPEIVWERGRNFNITEVGGYDTNVIDFKKSYINYQKHVQEKMLNIAEKENWNIIDSNQLNVQEVANQICEDIIKMVNK
ncbi:dTMP kinase [Blautia sp.]|uniref:dTMP kinase n=1 Tax=Blautia sp. TaxID=1955243 RepID=UPI002586DE2F|nr:hypothetical protein [Blautia sp.]